MQDNLFNTFNVDCYYESKHKDDKGFLYLCKYVDKDVAVLKKYGSDGQPLNSINVVKGAKKYFLSNKNKQSILDEEYKRQRYNRLFSIQNKLSEINSSISENIDFFHFKKNIIPYSGHELELEEFIKQSISDIRDSFNQLL